MIKLTATALCLRCEWETDPAAPTEADKAAEKHASTGHPTMTTIIRRPAA